MENTEKENLTETQVKRFKERVLLMLLNLFLFMVIIPLNLV